MKKHVLFYLLFVLLAINARAQQNTVVTLGTSVTASQSNGPIVVDAATPTGYFSRHIGLYMAADISATPFTERILTKIAWYKDNADPYATTGGAMKIYVKQTAATSLAPPIGFGANWNTEFAGATEVYNVTMPGISSGAGWKEFVLPKPFTWDGTSNLEVFVEWTGVGTITNSLNWRYTNTGALASTLTTVGTGTTGLPATGNLPNIQLTFSSFNNDGGITAINAPASPVAPGVSTPISVTLKNFGLNPITAASIGWNVDGLAQPDYSWTGNLASTTTAAPVQIGTFTFPFGNHTIKAYPKTVNGVTDPLAINDTTTIQLFACASLSGNYTINKNAPSSPTNFQSFNAAAQALNACGVSGPVTITVASGSGPYNESVALVNVQGTNATNTITFEGNGNTLTSDNAVVFKIDRTHYLKLNNLVVTNTFTSTTVVPKILGIQLIGPSNNATISNCTVNMPVGNTSQYIIGLLLAEGANFNIPGNYSSNSLFENNTFNGGYYSIRAVGTQVTGSNPTGIVNNRVINNQFRDFYNTGILLSNADGTKIEGNSFSRPTRPDVGAFVGVQLSSSVNTTINKNQFFNMFGNATSNTSGVTGITVDAAAAAGSENIIKNNLFYNFNNTGAITGINTYSGSTSGLFIYHNTFSIENPSRPATNTSAIKGLNVTGTNANVKFNNNIVTINMPGTGNKHAIYMASVPAPTFGTNNNVLYIAAGQTNAHTGFLTSNRTTLADWQAANTAAPFDMNSVAVDPVFAGLATGNLKPTVSGVNNIGQPLAAVIDDFLGNPRNATTPDPGAYEFELPDAGVSAITAPNSGCNLTATEVITITVNNFGTVVLSNIPVSYTINGGTAVTGVVPGPIAPGATATYSFTQTANLSAPGSYTIVASANLTGDMLATNDAFTKVVLSSASPAIPTITAGGPVSFCSGGSVTLTAASSTTGATYQWFNNGTAISGATNTTYTATTAGNYTAVATVNNCSSTASAATAVTVNTTPATPTITAGGATTICSGGSVILTAASATTGATFQWFDNGTLITGATTATYTAITTGSYTVVATANGCPSTASAATSVTVNVAPAVPAISASGATTICSGGAVTLTAASATTGATYAWFLDGTAITGATNATHAANTSGSYTVVATANGCDATSTATIITVTPLPATPTIARNGFMLTSSSATGNQWYKDSNIITGATNATYNTTANGSYTVTVTDNSCTSDTSNAIVVVNTGINEDKNNLVVAVYPNPSTGLFNINLPNAKGCKLTVSDLSGKLIKVQTASREQNVLNMTGAAKGIYLLTISGETGTAVRKLIVE